MNNISRDELFICANKLVPDATFHVWLCFRVEQNVWAARQIVTGRITTTCLTNELRRKEWSVDRERVLRHTWYKNGQLFVELTWKDGKHDGVRRGRYANGQLHWKGKWKDGKQDGTWRFWHENGELFRKDNWNGGNRNGISREWDETGKLYLERTWKDDVKTNEQYVS